MKKNGAPDSVLETVGGQELLDPRRIPAATYRLQFNKDFTFAQAEALADYFEDLGISHYYASPIFKARAGSLHGYDVCDHGQLNPELGGEDAFAALASTLRSRGMGLLLDMVPNHMGIGDPGNNWWMDVIENGPGSRYASFFDIDWHPVKPELENKVLLPILEDQYGDVLENSKLRLAYENGAFYVCYYETKLPLAPRSYRRILSYPLDDLARRLGGADPHLQELQSILTALHYLPPRTELSEEKIAERNREKEVIKRRIASLYNNCEEVRLAIEQTVHLFNGTPGMAGSFDLLDELLADQAYRPAFWRVATEEINYRRFFDINEMAAIRVELPEVFRSAHSLVFHLLAEQKITGLRVDHPDGLRNPTRYFRQLQEEYLFLRCRQDLKEGHSGPLDSQQRFEQVFAGWFEAHSNRREGATDWPLFVVAEKILAAGETLPEDWAVHGTTGYDFLNEANGIFIESRNRRPFDRIYSRFAGRSIRFEDLVNSSKKMIMLVSTAGEINSLAHQLDVISEKIRRYRDFTLNSLTFAIREVIACLPVYRTYVAGTREPSQRDQNYIEIAVAEAKKRNPRSPRALFEFLRDTLLLRNLSYFPEDERARVVDFVMRFQQITGPVMAKGLEDTAFYAFNRLVSLNEVGGHPANFGMSVEQFHRRNAERLERFPHSLVATSTHDTKRGEDVRARINALSEIPGEWHAALTRWSRLNTRRKTRVQGEMAPERNDEYLLYQTMLGAWPPDSPGSEHLDTFRERMTAYMFKAAREAKVHTSWVNPNEEYESALQSFVNALLDDRRKNRFLEDIRALQRRLAFYGRINSLAQVLLKLTVPGIPDFYQGTELWDLSLVDPDNRRPVDYERRRAMLAELNRRLGQADDLSAPIRELLETAQDGRIKLYLIHKVLRFRRSHKDLFSRGSYLPLEVVGEAGEHVCAFARIRGSEAALVVIPRLVVRLTAGIEQWPLGAGIWRDTRLALPLQAAGESYHNPLTGETAYAELEGNGRVLRLSSILNSFPVALLVRN